jgi:D-glycero-D-manno-heptose 1,7-bisphosphate phosphatase
VPDENFNFILPTIRPQFASKMNRAVFLDRDGTLIVEKTYLHQPEEVQIFPGAGAALKRLADAGFKLFIVTNQSGIGRGYYSMADAERVNDRVAELLARDGVRFEKIYIAPEAPDQPSRVRKPSPQFIFDARDEFDLNLAESFMVGDKLIDLECGWNAGVKKSILVRTGYGAGVERDNAEQIKRAIIVNGLTEMAEWILSSLKC